MQTRIWEIDYFRGIAILLMVIFHLVVDLRDFHHWRVEYLSGFWYYVGKLSAILFIYLAGISSGLNKRAIRHGLTVLAAALVVSVVTYFFNSTTYVRFGILHFLGLSILFSPVLRRISSIMLAVLAVILFVLPVWTDQATAATSLLLPVGITPAAFISMDYYPLVPWLGVFIAGMLTGRHYYAERRSLLPEWRGGKRIIWLGRHSLLVYLLHQPVLLTLLYLIL